MKSSFKMYDFDDYEAEAKWLNEQSAKGRNLLHAPQFGLIYWFKEGEEAQYIYDIDLRPRGYYQDDSVRAFLKETGWEIVDRSLGGLTYLRRPVDLAGSNVLYTDADSIVEFLKKIRTKISWGLYGMIFVIMTNVFNAYWISSWAEHNLYINVISTAVLGVGIIMISLKRGKLSAKIDMLTT
ncbi:MAG: DUF2812 domain-containing protein [Pseudomonadota bacterium]